MIRALASTAIIVGALLASSSALAEPLPRKPRTQWYGWQTLTVDTIALSTFFLSTQRDLGWTGLDKPSALTLASAGIYILGAPIVHASHERPGATAFSAAIRLASMGFVAGAASTCGSGSSDAFGACLTLAWFGAGSVIAVIVVDGTAIAREPVPVRETSLRIGPQLDASGAPSGVMLGGAL